MTKEGCFEQKKKWFDVIDKEKSTNNVKKNIFNYLSLELAGLFFVYKPAKVKQLTLLRELYFQSHSLNDFFK